MKCLIIGMGEVGRAHYENLARHYGQDIYHKDKGPDVLDINGMKMATLKPDIMLIATQCDPAHIEDFEKMVLEYALQFNPRIIDILTTTPCGTTERIDNKLHGISVSKSSTRGMHPNLAKFLIDIPKHIGGPGRDVLREFYSAAGWECVLHEKSRTVELSHILNNFIYGVNIMAADECARYCREYGVDYMEFLKYRETNNTGFTKAGYPSKVSPILYPSSGSIGGHCVRYAPTTINKDIKGKLAQLLETYGK